MVVCRVSWSFGLALTSGWILYSNERAVVGMSVALMTSMFLGLDSSVGSLNYYIYTLHTHTYTHICARTHTHTHVHTHTHTHTRTHTHTLSHTLTHTRTHTHAHTHTHTHTHTHMHTHTHAHTHTHTHTHRHRHTHTHTHTHCKPSLSPRLTKCLINLPFFHAGLHTRHNSTVPPSCCHTQTAHTLKG